MTNIDVLKMRRRQHISNLGWQKETVHSTSVWNDVIMVCWINPEMNGTALSQKYAADRTRIFIIIIIIIIIICMSPV